MREILFRGKHDGEWVYGDLVNGENGELFILESAAVQNDYGDATDLTATMWWEVDEETVAQLAVVRGDLRIFGDDVVHFKGSGISGKGVVYWNDNVGQWWIKDIREVTKKRGQRHYPFYDKPEYKYRYRVDGNIHDHPEFLKTGGEE